MARADVPVKQRGSWPKVCCYLRRKNQATFFSPSENWCLPTSTLKPEERDFCCGLRSVDAYDQPKRI